MSAGHSREKLVLVTLETVIFLMGPGTGKWDTGADMKTNPKEKSFPEPKVQFLKNGGVGGDSQ